MRIPESLTALLQRQRTGRGTALEVSLFEALGEWMGYAMYYTSGGKAPERTGASHATIAPYGPYRTRDGEEVIFGIHNNREWATFCTMVLEHAALGRDSRFESNYRARPISCRDERRDRSSLHEPHQRRSPRPTDAAQIANARINTVEQFMKHPQLTGRASWRRSTLPVRANSGLDSASKNGRRRAQDGRYSSAGQHSESVLKELGFDNLTIRAVETGGS